VVDGEVGADMGSVVSSECGKTSALDEASGRVVFLSDGFAASLAGSDMRGLFEGVDVDGTRPRQRSDRFEGGVSVGVGIGADAGLGK
jgi:hypothetical protein